MELALQQAGEYRIAVEFEYHVPPVRRNGAEFLCVIVEHVCHFQQHPFGNHKTVILRTGNGFLPDCQPVAVNGCHMKGIALHLKQFAGEHWFRLADRSCITCLANHGIQYRLFDLHADVQIQTGQSRIFLRGHGGDLKLGGITEQFYHIVVIHFHGYHIAGEPADSLTQQTGKDHKFAGAV